MNIGATIRLLRLEKGLSQGDMEKRSGMMRCQLSRFENGHIIPSLETLSKIADALEVSLGQFFRASDDRSPVLPISTGPDVRFLAQVRRYTTNLRADDRKVVLSVVKKLAAGAGHGAATRGA
jgi:transcriptional regulator with XRE-family HTH domain